MTKRKSPLKLLSAILVLFLLCRPLRNRTNPSRSSRPFDPRRYVEAYRRAANRTSTLVGPNGDTHVYQPTPPMPVGSASQAFFVNGLEFEGWIDRLVKASVQGTRVVHQRD